jgi:predicted enzyme related to lactoylglutathione lyase
MSVRWYSVVVDCTDISAQSRWWAQVLDWRIIYEDASEVVVVPPYVAEHAAAQTPPPPDRERGPGLIFVAVPDRKSAKNRLHIDLAPPADQDQDAEVRRLEAIGARRVDIGQDRDKVSWVVMADPEGNEFCVLSPRG